jgi:4-aminobutyrate aminotransferase-like enzyme
VAPYCYRCPLELKYPDCGVACADDVEEVIRTTTSGRLAAFIAEPILGVGGFITPPLEHFGRAAEIAPLRGAGDRRRDPDRCLSPPLNIAEADADDAADRLDQAFAAAGRA